MEQDGRDRTRPTAPRTRHPAGAVALGFAGAALLASSAPLWRGAQRGTWRLTLPLVPVGAHPLVVALLFLVAAGAVVAGWWWLVAAVRDPAAGRERRRLGWVAVALVAWWLPVSLGPPLLSNDVYSYVAQGTLAARGVDPTTVGPYALGVDPAFFQVDPVWASTAAPYGPVGVSLARAGVEAAGEDPAGAVWAIRALVVTAVALAAWATVRLARRLGRDPALVLALAIANPLVTVHLVGGVHNDAWMLALVLWGFVAVRGGRRVLGVVLLAAALGVKLTAGAAVLAVGWCLRPSPTTVGRRALDAAGTVAASFALLVLAGRVAGVGPGWVAALRSTGTVLTTFAPATLAGLAIGRLLTTRPDRLVGPLRLLGLAAAGGIAWRVLLQARRLGAELACALILLAGTLLGPVVWPWYLPVGVALLAVAGPLRYLPAAMVLVSAVLLTVWPTSADMGLRVGPWQPALQLTAIGVVLAVAVRVQQRTAPFGHAADGATAAAGLPVSRTAART